MHRCGRTGRAGKSGKAVTFFTGENHEKSLAGEFMRVLRDAGAEVPKEMDRFPSTIKKKGKSLPSLPFLYVVRYWSLPAHRDSGTGLTVQNTALTVLGSRTRRMLRRRPRSLSIDPSIVCCCILFFGYRVCIDAARALALSPLRPRGNATPPRIASSSADQGIQTDVCRDPSRSPCRHQ